MLQSKNIVLEKTVEYISQVNDQLKEFNALQQREQKLGKKFCFRCFVTFSFLFNPCNINFSLLTTDKATYQSI